MMLKITFLPLWPPNGLWPNDYYTWDMLGLIDGKIQLNSDKVRQSYIIKTKMGLRYWLTLQRVVVLTFRYR